MAILSSLVGCGAPSGSATPSVSPSPPSIVAEAGFVDAPPRAVAIHGEAVSIESTARLFYNLRPADESPEARPIFVLFNGYADDIVRAYGTGPTTVVAGGAVENNPASLTRLANLLYIEPRQSGYSYDVLTGRAQSAADCSPDVFNEYVDAADVLLGVLAFLDAHPRLRGPLYWVGESYAGVRITWILTYLRSRWELVPYVDDLLRARIAATRREASLDGGQILLEAWLAGGAETTAIANACSDAAEIEAVSLTVAGGCGLLDACTCAAQNDRSPYDFASTTELQAERVAAADQAHVLPDRAAALLGVPLTAVPGLAADERAAGFKCATPDDTVPSDSALVALLGPLEAGQVYYVPYSPLQPGKETATATLDWRTRDYEPRAFADDLRDVPAFLTKGDLDLVVPTVALAPALGFALGASRVDTAAASRVGLRYPDGERFVSVFEYPGAGHMISMLEPDQLSRDVAAWLHGLGRP